MTSMNVPDPVMSLAVSPKSRDSTANFSRALNRFTKEDPTFKVSLHVATLDSCCAELHCSGTHLMPPRLTQHDYRLMGADTT